MTMCMVNQLVSWHFQLNQPQRITSQLKTMFYLSPVYSARKSSNHKLSKNHKISPDTNLHKILNTNFLKNQSIPYLVSPLLKKKEAYIRLAWLKTIYELYQLKCWTCCDFLKTIPAQKVNLKQSIFLSSFFSSFFVVAEVGCDSVNCF